MIGFLHTTKLYRSGGGIRDFDCRIADGELVVFEGSTGAGKTTLLRLLCGVEKPDSGRVVVNGTSLADLSSRHLAEYRRQIGLISAGAGVLPDRNLLDNVALPLHIRKAMPRRAIKLKVLDALTRVGLTGRAGQRRAGLSAGERIRALLARAIANEPSLLLLDDPLANLGGDSAEIVLQILREEHQQGALVIIGATDASHYAALAPRIVQIAGGRLVADHQPMRRVMTLVPPTEGADC